MQVSDKSFWLLAISGRIFECMPHAVVKTTLLRNGRCGDQDLQITKGGLYQSTQHQVLPKFLTYGTYVKEAP